MKPDTPRKEQAPSLTSGPARFVATSDGSKDCLALLVTDVFLEKLNDMFEQDRDLDTISGPLIHAKMDIDGIETSIQMAEKSLETAKSGTEKVEIKRHLEHQRLRLIKLCQRRDELEERSIDLKREISRSSNYAHYVLETAMKSANLLRQDEPRPQSPVDTEEPIKVPSRQQIASPTSQRSLPSSEEVQRQIALDELRDCWYHLDKIQRLFNEREYLYHEKLAEYRQDCRNGTCSITQSELDRRHLDYSMRLTGALIEAESNFERARSRADALGAGSDYSDSSCYHRYDEDTSLENAQQAMQQLIEALLKHGEPM